MIFVAITGTAGLLAIIALLFIMARLTQRWESVTSARSYYQMFYVSAALVAVASLVRLVRVGYLISDLWPSILSDPQSWLYVCFYHVPLAIGMTISLVVTWRNWGWLLGEQSG